jgi:hypothetical protein
MIWDSVVELETAVCVLLFIYLFLLLLFENVLYEKESRMGVKQKKEHP